MLIGIMGYVLLQLGIGAVVSRSIKTEEDYLVAGRSLGYPLTIFTVFATWFGAETCIGAAGSIYESGLSGGSADPFGYGLCILILGAFFARKLWTANLTTPADFIRRRYSVSAERTVVLLMVPTSLLWAAAQIRAFGQVLAVASGVELTLTIIFAAVVVILYTAVGGILADAWTDLIQGGALVLGLGVLFVSVMRDGGAELLLSVPPERFDPIPADAGLLDTLEAWAIPVAGSLFAAELITRVISARSPQVARNGAIAAGALYLTVGLIPATLGLIGPQLLPDLVSGEEVLPALGQAYLGPVMYTVFAGALISAILSTVDSALLVSSSLVSHNIVVQARPDLSERAKVLVARLGVVLFGIVASVIAISSDSVYGLVIEASAFGSAGLFVVFAVGLSGRRGGGHAAVAALLAGLVSWIVGAYIAGVPHPFLASMATAAVGFGIGAWFDRRQAT